MFCTLRLADGEANEKHGPVSDIVDPGRPIREADIRRKAGWPTWTPPAAMIVRELQLAERDAGGNTVTPDGSGFLD